MTLLPNGQYRILNAKFPTQATDLLHGVPTGVVGGFVNNSNTFHMVWNLKNAGDRVNQFTLTNPSPSANGAYASVNRSTVGTAVHGSPDVTFWTLRETSQSGQYRIMAPSAFLSHSLSAWSLANDENWTPIRLAQISPDDLSQVWTFQPQVKTGENVVKSLSDLE